jgi:hypothetical protein
MVLKTQGTPYSVCGAGDLLSLFRCISCKYICGTDTTRASLMGAGARRCRRTPLLPPAVVAPLTARLPPSACVQLAACTRAASPR